MTMWSEWKNISTDFEDLTIATVGGYASVYGGADIAGSTRTGQTTSHKISKSGKATLIFNAYAVTQQGGFDYKGINVYRNGAVVASNPKSRITIDVAAGDTVYAIGTYRVGESTTTSHISTAYVVLSIIEHD